MTEHPIFTTTEPPINNLFHVGSEVNLKVGVRNPQVGELVCHVPKGITLFLSPPSLSLYAAHLICIFEPMVGDHAW